MLCSKELAPGLSVMKSPIDGLGCFATAHFPKGGLIAEYAGERISYREAMRRMQGTGGICISELDADCYIDGSIGGNGTEFINHSCEPNADALITEGLMFVFPIRDITPGEEITVDYLNSFEEDRTVCKCRSASCRNRGNDRDFKKPGLVEQYGASVSYRRSMK